MPMMITNARLKEAVEKPEILSLEEIKVLAGEVLRSRKFIRQEIERNRTVQAPK